METLHRLHTLDPRDFYDLPMPVQMAHMAHVKNLLTEAYSGEHGAPKSQPIDAIDLMRSQAAFKHAPPSQQVIENARMVLAVPGLPDLLVRDARETLQRAGLDA